MTLTQTAGVFETDVSATPYKFHISQGGVGTTSGITLTSQGRVGVNQQAPTKQLVVNGDTEISGDLTLTGDIQGNVNATGDVSSAQLKTAPLGSHYRIWANSYGGLALDYLGVNSTTWASNRLYLDGIYGNVNYAGSLTHTSDDRLKINERPITGAIDTLMGLQFFEYEKVQSEGDTEGFMTERGVIAQHLQGTELAFAVGGSEERLTVAYQNIIITLAQAAKDLVGQVRALEARIAVLEST